MTTQIPDLLYFNGREYYVFQIEGDGLPTPKDFGMEVGLWVTASWSGYFSTYACENKRFLLQEMFIGTLERPSQQWRPINGIMPEIKREVSTRDGTLRIVERIAEYRGLALETEFSGGAVMAAGEISEWMWHDLPRNPFPFESVYELLFVKGNLIQAIDHSESARSLGTRMLEWRQERERQIDEMRRAGHSEREIENRFYAKNPHEEEFMRDVNWHFSRKYRLHGMLGYGLWDSADRESFLSALVNRGR